MATWIEQDETKPKRAALKLSLPKSIKAFLNFAIKDPRHYQITALTTLIAIGVTQYAFGLPWWHVAAVVSSALMTQLVCSKLVGIKFDARSPLISSLSLTLLLRTGSVWLSLAAGMIAIGSKFVLRWKGKHIFNPANFAICVLALLSSSAWVSPGQWGAAPWLAIALFGIGGAVTRKASRWDVSFAFLFSFAALVFGRALYLGDPLSIPLHQLQSGALLIFAFFMISDPKTTPDRRLARVIYAALVALIGFIIAFFFHNSAGVIFALILTAPLVPLFDRIFKGARYYWPGQTLSLSSPTHKGASHETV